MGSVSSERTAKADLTPMGAPCSRQRYPSRFSTGIAAFLDPVPLHICNLRQNSDNELPDAFCNGAKAKHFDRNTFVDQLAYGRLHIKGISAQPIDCCNMQHIAFSDIIEQGSKRRTISGRDST